MGYAYAQKKQVISLRTDFRRAGMYEKVNLMLEESAWGITSLDTLLNRLKSQMICEFIR
jgi:hypothetical protein